MNDNNDKIIEAAYMKFMEKGYKATKTAEIATAAGINESTLFRNFKNKETLFQSSIDFYLRKAISLDFDILHYSNNLTEDLRRMIEVIFTLSLELVPSYRLLVKVSLVKSEILNSINSDIVRQKNIFSHYLQGMISRNMIKEIDTTYLTEIIYSRTFVSAFDYLVKENENTGPEILENRISELTDIFIELLRGDKIEKHN